MATTERYEGHLGVSLRICHDAHSPGEISRLLGREAQVRGLKGGRRGSRSSRSVWPTNYWSSDFDVGETAADRIASVARFAEDREHAMGLLLRTGGSAEIYAFIGLGREEVGFSVPPSVLASLGRIGIGLGLDIFPPAPKGAPGLRRS